MPKPHGAAVLPTDPTHPTRGSLFLPLLVGCASGLAWLLDAPSRGTVRLSWWRPSLPSAPHWLCCAGRNSATGFTRSNCWSFIWVFPWPPRCWAKSHLFGRSWQASRLPARMRYASALGLRRFDRYWQCLGLALVCAHLLVGIQLLHNGFQLFLYDTSIFDHSLRYVLAPFLPVVQGPESLLVCDGRSAEGLHITYEQTHIVWAVRFIVLWVVLGAFLPGIPRSCLRFAFIGVCYAMAGLLSWWAASLGAWYVGRDPAPWLNRTFSIVCELAGVLVAASVLPRLPAPTVSCHTDAAPRWNAAYSLSAAASVCLFAVFCLWFPLGDRRPSRTVLIDDSHSSWEVSDLPFDLSPAAFSKRAGYSYSVFAAFVGKAYTVRLNRHEPLTKDQLADVSVLILKTPTIPFSPQETQDIREFVKRGGGLFVHGDHTNLYGMSSILNDLLEPTGMAFNFDDQAALDGRPSRVSLSPGIGHHPCIAGLGELQFLTSCTLALRNVLAEPVVVGEAIFSENLHHGRPGFFGNMAFDGRDRFGRFVQAAVVPYGQGRVAAFCDSTLFSNFTLFASSQADYALRTIDYLHRRPGRQRSLVFMASLGSLVLSVVLWWRSRESVFATVCRLSGVLTVSGLAGGILVAALLRHLEGLPIPLHPAKRVSVVFGEGNVTDSLTLTHTNDGQKLGDFGSLLLVLQRLGVFPKVTDGIAAATAEPALILVNPTPQLDDAAISRLHEYVVRQGNRLFVICERQHRSGADQPPAGAFRASILDRGHARKGAAGSCGAGLGSGRAAGSSLSPGTVHRHASAPAVCPGSRRPPNAADVSAAARWSGARFWPTTKRVCPF